MANIFKYIEVEYSKLSDQIDNWLKKTYGKSDINFGPASPHGQTLEIQKELFQHNIIYMKNAVNQINIEDTTNDKMIKNIARIAGHNISRAISATGTLKFSIKPNINISDEIKDGVVVINDNTILKNKTNNLFYVIKLGTDQNRYNMYQSPQFFLNIIQGKTSTDTFTGDGTRNKSYRVNIATMASIDNFNYVVKYNGTVLSVKDHLYDMLSGEMACYTRTGFNGGLDVYFGNENFGFIPENGSIIEVSYILSNGSEGEVMNNVQNDWKNMTDITDAAGNPLKIDNLFNITNETPINFSADAEDSNFIKATVPYVSRNFVLATPAQFIYHLKKMSMFSKVNAYNTLDDNDFSVTETVIDNSLNKLRNMVNKNDGVDKINKQMDNFLTMYNKFKSTLNDNEIYLYLIPDIKKYFNDNMNYFNIPFDVFYLDSNEQSKVISYLRQVGILSLSTNIKIVQPTISRYITHIYIRRFSNVIEDIIKSEIISSVSDYLLVNDRFDRIPRSELITMISSINGVDSANVIFVSKKNEDYHKKRMDNGLPPDKTVLGLDPVYGDIIIDKSEYAVVRGGWRDRNGIWYNENPYNNGMSSINITFNGITEV